MNAKAFVDTNVLGYGRDASEPEKQGRAWELLAALWEQRSGRLSFQVLQEYYVTVTAKLSPGLDQESARREVRTLLAWQPLPVDGRIMEKAWLLQELYLLSWRDALIAGAAQAAGCPYLLSEDFQEGLDLGEIGVVNPFRTRPQEVG